MGQRTCSGSHLQKMGLQALSKALLCAMVAPTNLFWPETLYRSTRRNPTEVLPPQPQSYSNQPRELNAGEPTCY